MKEYRFVINEFLQNSSSVLIVHFCLFNFVKTCHKAAANDARMAIGIWPDSPHGYSLLGLSLFYFKDYAGTVITLEESMRLMQPHEEPNAFEKAYLAKAQDSLAPSSPVDVTATTAAIAFTSMTYTTSSEMFLN